MFLCAPQNVLSVVAVQGDCCVGWISRHLIGMGVQPEDDIFFNADLQTMLGGSVQRLRRISMYGLKFQKRTHTSPFLNTYNMIPLVASDSQHAHSTTRHPYTHATANPTELSAPHHWTFSRAAPTVMLASTYLTGSTSVVFCPRFRCLQLIFLDFHIKQLCQQQAAMRWSRPLHALFATKEAMVSALTYHFFHLQLNQPLPQPRRIAGIAGNSCVCLWRGARYSLKIHRRSKREAHNPPHFLCARCALLPLSFK